MSGYIGVQPVPKATQRREYFTATNGQTSFSTSGYTPEYIDVYMNGVKLSPADFTATNGSDVVLGSGAATGDLLQIISFLPFSVLNQAFSGTLSVAGAVTANAGDVKVRSTSGSTLELTNTSTTLGDNAFVGGLAFRNDDTSGSPPHYAGIKARTDGSGGTEMDLEFYANRDKYETDAPHMILRSTGNLGINIADASQKLHVGGNAIITGLTRLGNGTESSPAYQFVDDTNTGMYRSSSDVLGFSTGGANRLTLNSTGAIFAGNVGMGTISPAPDYGSDIALEIKGASSPGLVINDTGQGSKYGIHADSNDLKITYGSGALATFQNDGKVGIGTSAPKRHIHLNGGNETTKIQITNQTTGSGSDGDGFQIGIATDGTANIEQRENADLVFTTNNTERFRIDSAGLISAGPFGGGGNAIIAGSSSPSFTNQPGTNLLLKSGDGSGTGGSYMTFSTSEGGASGTTVRTAQERMRIDNSGRVGIANDTPGDFNASGDDLVIGNSSGNRGITIRSGTSNSGNLFFADGLSGDQLYRGFIQYQHADDRLVLGAGGDDRVWISSSGNVGIGNADPSAKIDAVTNSNVYAAEFIQQNTSNGDGVLIQVGSTAAADYVLTCRSNAGAVSALAVKADGKVGIGTFLPTCHLSVKGPTSDSGKITEFYGSRQEGSLQVTNYLTGSDNDRVGLYWRNSGVVNTRMWCDDTMDIRVHSGDPSSDTDGTVVGTQTFSGTHIYKTDATDLVVGQAVRLVGRKLVKTTSANDKLCVGIYAGQSGKIVDSFGQACNETDGYGHAVIALGDTRMKQSGTTTIGVLVDGSVEAGDLLCTSGTAGKLTVQADDIIRSYTVGKAIEDGNASAPVYAYIYCG
jgi:hypothetical protein